MNYNGNDSYLYDNDFIQIYLQKSINLKSLTSETLYQFCLRSVSNNFTIYETKVIGLNDVVCNFPVDYGLI